MSQQLINSKPENILQKVSINKDLIIALGWSSFLGLPLFVVHMVLFDFEHNQHLNESYSFIPSIISSVPHHPFSLALWLI
ncbi:MAG: hypothetical protein ACYDH1_20475, partial [Anaerolineaceae bacterium]